MISLDMPVIVEGRYDKKTLENIVDTLIIATDGFSVFKDREKCALIRSLAEKSGIIIMTDSDSAGSVIRSYLKKIAGSARIVNVYIPCIKGKEKRKASPSKEGFLGVEGMTEEVILQALSKSGICASTEPEHKRRITKNDMYLLGLSGRKDSSLKRKELLKKLELPENLSSSAMLDVINDMYGYEQFAEVIKDF